MGRDDKGRAVWADKARRQGQDKPAEQAGQDRDRQVGKEKS